MSNTENYTEEVYTSIISAIKDLPVEKILEIDIFVDKLLEKKNKEIKRFTKKQIIDLMKQNGINTLEELGFSLTENPEESKNKKQKNKRQVKYSFEGNEWSGIGREPSWVAQKAQENHMSVDEFKERIEIKKDQENA